MKEGDIKELEILYERATGGRWTYDCMANPDGYALAWLGNFYIDTDAPKQKDGRYRNAADDAALIVALHARWPELRELAITALRSTAAPPAQSGAQVIVPREKAITAIEILNRVGNRLYCDLPQDAKDGVRILAIAELLAAAPREGKGDSEYTLTKATMFHDGKSVDLMPPQSGAQVIKIIRRYLQHDSQRPCSWHEVEDCIEAIRSLKGEPK